MTAGCATEQSPYAGATPLLRIALAGNPNCGKTTLFNALTGLRYKVANYPGVTVEKKEGLIRFESRDNVFAVDLPGIYSLSGHSIDEKIASDALLGYLKNEPPPNLIVAVIDACNIERNLYLATQLIDLGIPIILALNMSDLAEKQGISIRKELLSRQLDAPVVSLSAHKGEGVDELRRAILSMLQTPKASSKAFAWLPQDSEFGAAALEIGNLEAESINIRQNGPRATLIGSEILSDARQAVSGPAQAKVLESRTALSAKAIDVSSFEATERYRFINSVVKNSVSYSEKNENSLSRRVDALLTHKVWGSLIFVLLMGAIFQSIFLWAKIPMDFIDDSFSKVGAAVGGVLPDGKLKSLLIDGIIAGVGSVIVFIPQIAMLFFFLGLLEDSGYLSRAAFLMDKVMRRVGLQGRSFIPLLSSFACAIPGILSTRTIPSFTDRLATIMVAPLMSCSARLPVYALLIAACVPNTYYFGFVSLQGLVLLSMYFLGIIGAAAIAWILKRTILRGEPALFVMEMPPMRVPSPKLALREVLDRIIIFLQSAGTIILACSVVLWFLASFPTDVVKESFAGQIGSFIEPVLKPLGFNWEIGVGIIASFAAREVFISSLATVYNLQAGSDSTGSVLTVLKGKSHDGTFSLATALSLMVFYVFCCQCMSTLAVCRRETGSWRWTAFMFSYMTAMAYVASFATYQFFSRVL